MPEQIYDFLGAAWDDSDFAYHYYFGGGAYVSTTTMGLNAQVLSIINNQPRSDFISKIDAEVNDNVWQSSQASGNSTMRVTNSGGYDFGSITRTADSL